MQTIKYESSSDIPFTSCIIYKIDASNVLVRNCKYKKNFAVIGKLKKAKSSDRNVNSVINFKRSYRTAVPQAEILTLTFNSSFTSCKIHIKGKT